ncbi:MAG TPA: 4-(cytidine 5'-diphospho)-2-C-methyl-D-erythritol kinase [Sphingomonas sp.]|jgi:4-diphosphocytidyl-2-C-methyl-D-erythritol kinase|uniref:4-(cytidine 5'-diphospho)-2-C-methyl-D-erythritol kinase n=1 Tax=Sphingomonas sp. TaxID=28214 RepID=UPI002EDAE66E
MRPVDRVARGGHGSAMIETAFAKINLALHVRRRRADGYHEIETLFAFAEDGDILTLDHDDVPDTEPLRIVGPFAAAIAGGDNLVTRAAELYRARHGGPAARFILDKRLPVAAGIGGGSADAAAALRVLARRDGMAEDDPALLEIAGRLGADVPACLLSRTVRGDGRGDALRCVASGTLAGMPLLLVNPNVPLATGPVFAGWDGEDRGPLADGDPLMVAADARNDLEPPACALRPEIPVVLAWLATQPGVVLARMSGSGATCFALFQDAASRDRVTVPDIWWRLASRVRA